MDVSNYPIHLTTAELEYELSIRGAPDLPTHRLKSVALKEFLVKEQSGTAEAPKRCNRNTDDEIRLCSAIYDDAVTKADEAIQSGSLAELPRCVSRLIHVQSRLERLSPIEESTCDLINDLFDVVYETLTRVVCAIHVPPQKKKSAKHVECPVARHSSCRRRNLLRCRTKPSSPRANRFDRPRPKQPLRSASTV